MAIYKGDQQTTAYGMINGVHSVMTPAIVKATVSNGATAYKFNFSFTTHNPATGAPLSFRRGVSYHLDPALRTFLLSVSAPMVSI